MSKVSETLRRAALQRKAPEMAYYSHMWVGGKAQEVARRYADNKAANFYDLTETEIRMALLFIAEAEE